jgi:hypothetical protein
VETNRYCYTGEEFPENYLLDAFPDRTNGLVEWRRLVEQLPNLSEPEPDQPFTDPLRELRALHSQRAQQLMLHCPRVFISHRRCDAPTALWVAWLANSHKFDYWLDILDPTLAAATIHPNLVLSMKDQRARMTNIFPGVPYMGVAFRPDGRALVVNIILLRSGLRRWAMADRSHWSTTI